MIDLIFYFGTEIIFIRVRGNSVMFANSAQGSQWCPIDGLRLSKAGVIKEFPDLEYDADWHDTAIRIFKDKITLLGKESAVADYIIKDLKNFGYVPKFYQEAGFRKRAII
jgi:hypothetical protein